MAGDFSTNGARFDSLGQRPGFTAVFHQALKGRHNGCLAPSGLGSFLTIEPRALPFGPRALPFGPRALPWAIEFCPVGAEDKSKTAKRAVLEKMVNANLEGMGYGG